MLTVARTSALVGSWLEARTAVRAPSRAAWLMVIGGVVGGLGAAASRRLLASIVPVQVSRDAWAVILLALGLSVVGLVASLMPARRAASIQPMQALRND